MHLNDGIDVHIDLQVCKTLSDEVRQDLNPTKEAANLTDTLLNFFKLYSFKFIVLNSFKNLSSGI
jgi:hypothetical protein